MPAHSHTFRAAIWRKGQSHLRLATLVASLVKRQSTGRVTHQMVDGQRGGLVGADLSHDRHRPASGVAQGERRLGALAALFSCTQAGRHALLPPTTTTRTEPSARGRPTRDSPLATRWTASPHPALVR